VLLEKIKRQKEISFFEKARYNIDIKFFLPGPEKSSWFKGPAACASARGREGGGDEWFIQDSKITSIPKK